MNTNEQPFTVSNPRKEDYVADYPAGGNRRGAKFIHESCKRGERIGRITKNRHGVECKPKYTTYSQSTRLVDGSDGKTHILCHGAGFIQILSCNMKHGDFSVFSGQDNFEEYVKMAQS